MELVQTWQNVEKKRNTGYDFRPSLYVGGENNKTYSANSGLKPFRLTYYSQNLWVIVFCEFFACFFSGGPLQGVHPTLKAGV